MPLLICEVCDGKGTIQVKFCPACNEGNCDSTVHLTLFACDSCQENLLFTSEGLVKHKKNCQSKKDIIINNADIEKSTSDKSKEYYDPNCQCC